MPGLLPDARAVLMADVRLSYGLPTRLPAAVPEVRERPAALPRMAIYTLDARAAPLPLVTLPARPATGPGSNLQSVENEAPANWRVPIEAEDVTSIHGGTYAVGDTLASFRLRRGPRSPLKTMFVLRIDGKDESPAFSIGGGGVAAALWRAGQAN
ncbi:hypothetical protein TS85_07205 [Sphingomonas hengshuiensis]|uniref:Uncharacterized protein n=1 Tax=Sphingomonas hengshuiensis TaxID=1609977 RepID=A0A7U4LEL7_9SPHN|nr:hypothetical protein TS85_07205 [Sphingomonas hengshuiensis]